MHAITNRRVEHARKPHVCDWCLRRIEVGEPYQYSYLVDGGDSWSWHECDRCKGYVGEMMTHEFWGGKPTGGGWTTEEFMEFMTECHPGVLEEWRNE